MKASELIQKLKDLEDRYGDPQITVHGDPVDDVKVTWDYQDNLFEAQLLFHENSLSTR